MYRLIRFLKMLLLLLGALTLLDLIIPQGAGAVPAGARFTNTFDVAAVIAYLVGTVLPLAVARIATLNWTSLQKFVAHAVLSAITGFLSQVLQAINTNTPFDWGTAVLSSFGVLAVGVFFHKAGYKKELAPKLQAKGRQ